jgi:hypothetical protein
MPFPCKVRVDGKLGYAIIHFWHNPLDCILKGSHMQRTVLSLFSESVKPPFGLGACSDLFPAIQPEYGKCYPTHQISLNQAWMALVQDVSYGIRA